MAMNMNLRESLGLEVDPVAIAFRDSAPADLPRVEGGAPSGCTYWKLAAGGRAFFTLAADHLGCAVGAYTHHAPLDEAKAAELNTLMSTMMGLEYLRGEEVPNIPRRAEELKVVLYAPYAGAATVFEPDLVLVRGSARSIMILAEAAHSAGLQLDRGVMLRPTCAMLPAALSASQTTMSIGCIGNRVYTGMDDGEMYVAIPGAQMVKVLERLSTLARANTELEKFHRSRLPVV
jgi:uncharacterized protein (DUF169 family)